jgi:hypothetical protein
MPDYIFLMHNDCGPSSSEKVEDWGPYLERLEATGCLRGGSAMGGGTCQRKTGAIPPVSSHLSGFIRVAAESLEHAKTLLTGNPVFEAGGTVEIRELPRTD